MNSQRGERIGVSRGSDYIRSMLYKNTFDINKVKPEYRQNLENYRNRQGLSRRKVIDDERRVVEDTERIIIEEEPESQLTDKEKRMIERSKVSAQELYDKKWYDVLANETEANLQGVEKRLEAIKSQPKHKTKSAQENQKSILKNIEQDRTKLAMLLESHKKQAKYLKKLYELKINTNFKNIDDFKKLNSIQALLSDKDGIDKSNVYDQADKIINKLSK